MCSGAEVQRRLAFFTRSCGCRQRAPAPGPPVEVLRARKRPFSTALAGATPGQRLGLNFVSVCKSSVCAAPRVLYKSL
jgi:hypothetical protein